MTLVGATYAQHIMLSVAAHRDDRKKLDQLAQQALDAAQAHGRAEIGTALHKLTQTLDDGTDPGPYPGEYAADIAAYLQATQGWRYAASGTFVVCDELGVAGTFDRLLDLTPRRISDLKTGSTVAYGGLSIAVQCAVYAHGQTYDPATGERGSLGDVDQETATVVHLPAGEGRCAVYDVDIAAGWEAAKLAVQVRNARTAARTWLTVRRDTDPIADLIAAAGTPDAVRGVWAAHEADWLPVHTVLARARVTALEGAQTPA